MKKVILFTGMILFVLGCSTTRFVDSWRNNEIRSFTPEKLLVIGVTDNLTARNIFEDNLKEALLLRNINAEKSLNVLDNEFTTSKKSEDEVDKVVKKLAIEGYDAIIITAVKGVEKKRSYYDNYNTFGYRWSRFGHYYYWYQDIYFSPHYYEDYNVYHVETSVYNINEVDNKSLVWVGALDIVNPQTISSTVDDYVSKIIEQLENERLIQKID